MTTPGHRATPENAPPRRSGPRPRFFASGCRGRDPFLRCRVWVGSSGWVIRPLFFSLLLGIHSIGAAAEASGDDLILEVRPVKNRVYLHEAIPVTVTLLVGAVSLRNIQYPRLEGAAFRTTEFSLPRQTNVIRDGHEVTAYAFSTTLIPSKPGTIELGPAELRCDRLAPAGGAAAFFGGGSEPRSVTVRSAPVSFTILPLPTRGRPADFTGAVGQFRLTREITPQAIRSGDAVTLTTRIQGNDAARFPCPGVDLPGTRAYPTRTRRSGDRLVCEQVLLVDADADLAIPAAHLTFFDPRTGRYDTARSAAILLKVAPPLRNANVRTTAPPATPPDPAGEPAAGPWWYALIGLPLLAAGLNLAFRRRRRAVAGHGAGPAPSLRALERALDEDDSGRFYAEAHNVAQQVVAWRLNRSPAGITAANLESTSEFSGAMAVLAELMHECDAVRYGNARRNPLDMKRHHQLLRAALRDAL